MKGIQEFDSTGVQAECLSGMEFCLVQRCRLRSPQGNNPALSGESLLHTSRRLFPVFRKLLLCLVLLLVLPAQVVRAQYVDEEYKMDLGVMLGGSFYMGDANYQTPFKNTEMAAGVVARFNLNPRMSVKCDVAMAKISGSTHGLSGVFPGGAHADFDRTLYEMGTQFEWNFWPYGNGLTRHDIRRFTPYMLLGMGATFAPEPAENLFTVNIPVGVGIKYKFAPRWNVGCEFAMRFTLSDRLDVVQREGLLLDDPYQIKGSGFKNKDSYGLLMFAVSYDLFPKCDNCNKE